ncbi:hypothetical protein [Thalassovita taeanensis]|nr:hypothetical protein [Thalassovita taeanensis]
MALQVTEFFGFEPLDPAGRVFADQTRCPFVGNTYIKPRHGGALVEQS